MKLFSLTRIVNLLSCRPSLTQEREASVALDSETEINIQLPPAKGVPEAVRNMPTLQISPYQNV